MHSALVHAIIQSIDCNDWAKKRYLGKPIHAHPQASSLPRARRITKYDRLVVVICSLSISYYSTWRNCAEFPDGKRPPCGPFTTAEGRGLVCST